MPLRVSEQDLNRLKSGTSASGAKFRARDERTAEQKRDKTPKKAKTQPAPQERTEDDQAELANFGDGVDSRIGLEGVQTILSHHLCDPQPCWRCKQKVRELVSLWLRDQYTHALCYDCSRAVAKRAR